MPEFPVTNEKAIGNILSEAHNLSVDQVQSILEYQKDHGVKFGEAAVALGVLKREDVLWALSQQFHYPYKSPSDASLSPELLVATQPFDETAEYFRDLRTKVMEALAVSSRRTPIVVCSPSSGDGKTFIAANLAAAFSQLGARTLIVDGDMRTPRMHEVFGIASASSGLSTILAGRSEANVIRPIDALPSLYLLPAGTVPPNPVELVQGQGFDMLIRELVSKFDYVVFDTPAASHGADARIMAAKCGTSMMVMRQDVSRMAELKDLSASLKRGGGTFLGVVKNTPA